jgi:hypothetical protein
LAAVCLDTGRSAPRKLGSEPTLLDPLARRVLASSAPALGLGLLTV